MAPQKNINPGYQDTQIVISEDSVIPPTEVMVKKRKLRQKLATVEIPLVQASPIVNPMKKEEDPNKKNLLNKLKKL